MAQETIYLLIGSNLGDKHKNLDLALIQIDKKIGKILRKSSRYETEPWGNTDQDSFINQAVAITSNLEPNTMLELLKGIEKQLGRTDSIINGPRLIDIDILMWGGKTIKNSHLEIPHPRLHLRNFALIPLMEIASDKIHPLFKKTIEELYDESQDPLDVFIIDED